MLNGTEVTLRDAPAPQVDLTDTGVAIVVDFAERGPLAPIELRSLEDVERELGARQTYSMAHDVIRAVLAEGGRRVLFSREVGPAAAPATATFNDTAGTPAPTLAADSAGPGASDLSVDIDVPSAGRFVVRVLRGTVELERSPEFTDKPSAVAWAQTGRYIRLRSLASALLPAATASGVALAGGSDDRANVSDVTLRAALDRVPVERGPAQVFAARATTQATHAVVHAYALATDRCPFYAAPNGATKTELIALATALRTSGARRGAIFAQWAIIDGPVAGTTVQIPYAAIQLGITARVDAELGPHHAAAGKRGVSRTVRALSAVYSDAERRELDDAGVNVAKAFPDGVRTFGNCTPANPVSDRNWVDLAATRVVMRISAQARQIAEGYDFATIDGQGHALAEYAGELIGMLLPHFRSGALYGRTPDEAFAVESGLALNPPDRLLAGELRTVLALRTSPHPGRNVVELVKTPITQSL